MPYHGKDIRSNPALRSHKSGRYVMDASGILRGKEGDKVDLHAFLTEFSPSVNVMAIETKIMRASGLFPGGYALVDKSKRVFSGALVVVRYNSQIIIRRLLKKEEGWLLIADDPREEALPVNNDVEIENLGVVIASFIKLL